MQAEGLIEDLLNGQFGHGAHSRVWCKAAT
jgi:hypothetical protein